MRTTTSSPEQPAFPSPEPIYPHSSPQPGAYDHMISPANRLLGFTARAVWGGVKGLLTLAFRLPRLFARINSHPDDRSSK